MESLKVFSFCPDFKGSNKNGSKIFYTQIVYKCGQTQRKFGAGGCRDRQECI